MPSTVMHLLSLGLLALLVAPDVQSFVGPAAPFVAAPAVSGLARARTTCSFSIGMSSAQADTTKAETAESLKATIRAEAAGTSNGIEATAEQVDAIAKAVGKLVALNPEPNLSTSTKATGTWDLVYTTTKGSSAGKVGPFVGQVTQEVDIEDRQYINYVTLGPLKGALDATWEVQNNKQWKVVFQTIQLSLFGMPVLKKDLGAQAGIWTLSYMDDDFRVLTARSLQRDKGNLYVLGRQS